MNFIEKALNELSQPDQDREAETSQSSKNKPKFDMKKVCDFKLPQKKEKCKCGKDKDKCKCDGKCDGKCKCESIKEGMSKRKLETKVEKACNCDGGACLDPNEHDDDCPAQKHLNGDGDDIDKAEYQMGDR